MLRRYQTRIIAPSFTVRGMPAASGSPSPSADGEATAAASAATVLLVAAPFLPPSVSRGDWSSRQLPRMPSGSTGAPAAATVQRAEEEEEENATCRAAREGEGHRRNAAQPLEAEYEEDAAGAAVAAMLCISRRPNSSGRSIHLFTQAALRTAGSNRG